MLALPTKKHVPNQETLQNHLSNARFLLEHVNLDSYNESQQSRCSAEWSLCQFGSHRHLRTPPSSGISYP